MTVLLVLLLILLVALILLGFKQEPRQPTDPEAELRAALDLKRIRSRLDVAWTKTELRLDAAKLRRDIAKTLDSDDRS